MIMPSTPHLHLLILPTPKIRNRVVPNSVLLVKKQQQQQTDLDSERLNNVPKVIGNQLGLNPGLFWLEDFYLAQASRGPLYCRYSSFIQQTSINHLQGGSSVLGVMNKTGKFLAPLHPCWGRGWSWWWRKQTSEKIHHQITIPIVGRYLK